MLQRSYFARYEQMSKLLLRYREDPAPKLVKRYENALSDLREHLYKNKMLMGFPKYPYDPEEDKTTHAFLRNPKGPGSIPNPDYKYKDVWKRIDGAKGIK